MCLYDPRRKLFVRTNRRLKNMHCVLRTQLTRSIVCAFTTIAITVGCSNFEHTLPWDRSPLHEKPLGSWQTKDDAVTPMNMHVMSDDSGALSIEIDIDAAEEVIKTDPSFPFSTRTRHVSFNGVVLASNDVDVLQIDMKSYEERDGEHEKTRDSSGEGYRFVRVVPADDSMLFQLLDIKSFSRYAESELSTAGTSLPATKFADCVDEKISILIFTRLLKPLLIERSSDLLTEDELSELERALIDDEKREVNPYLEMQQMRECVAYKLPGELLAMLFSADPNASFNDSTIQISKMEAESR